MPLSSRILAFAQVLVPATTELLEVYEGERYLVRDIRLWNDRAIATDALLVHLHGGIFNVVAGALGIPAKTFYVERDAFLVLEWTDKLFLATAGLPGAGAVPVTLCGHYWEGVT